MAARYSCVGPETERCAARITRLKPSVAPINTRETQDGREKGGDRFPLLRTSEAFPQTRVKQKGRKKEKLKRTGTAWSKPVATMVTPVDPAPIEGFHTASTVQR